MDKISELYKISNPDEVQKRAIKYFGKDVKIQISTNKNKKYMIYDPLNRKWIHFGQYSPPMEDFTYHNNLIRRERYLKRAMNIKGNWRNNPYSPNWLSIHLLW